MGKTLDQRPIQEVTELPKATQGLLISVGITTVGELRAAGQAQLKELLRGKKGVIDSGIVAHDILSIFGRK